MNSSARRFFLPAQPDLPWRPALVGLALTWVLGLSAWATGGPENVLLVVNPRSQDSLCIANHFQALRHIPRLNVFYLDWDPKLETTDVDTFREKILKPVIQAAILPNRGQPVRGRQIDYIVYSSDFPWGIQIDADLKKFREDLEKQSPTKTPAPDPKKPTWMTYCTPLASLNGLTYLWQPVLVKGFYVHPQANWYARTGAVEQAREPTLGFSSMTAYGPHGEAGEGPGRRYLLSMMLGVTAGRGNSRQEVLSYLQRSATADGTHPRGTIYFMQNGDIRSKVRQRQFPEAVKDLRALGVAAEIIDGILPQGKDDVQGAMVGIADFDWKSSQSVILPGAICEHFTSFGGDMHSNASQTPLSVWLRYGAAATSGAVTEPYSIPQKFPAPMMQVHYARGCTVAESFYQTVQCPYQLLIVGDPLCRPWANVPDITCTGLTAGETVQGVVKIKPAAHFSGSLETEHFELICDGLKSSDCPPDGVLELDTAKVADGVHEIRLVAVAKGPIAARGEKIIPFSCANHNRTIEVSCLPERAVSLKKSLVLTVKAPQAIRVEVFRGTRSLGAIPGSGKIAIGAETLGCGPVQLQVVAFGGADPDSWVFAPPLDINVQE
jgi:hypothetical protein